MRIAESTAKILANIPLPDEVSVVHRQAAVVDIGSCTTRVGFAGDDTPRIAEPTCVVKGTGKDESLCLKKAHECRATADVSRVVVKGEVNWDAMEVLLNHLDELLELSTKDLQTPLLLTEKILVPRAQRQKLAEILVERHAVTALHFVPSPVLALYAAGTCTGVSVEMGYDACHVVPVFQGCPLFHAVHMLNYGGDYLTRYMMATGPALPEVVQPAHRIDVWEHLKEKYCEACPNSETFYEVRDSEASGSVSSLTDGHSNSYGPVQHQLPDGTVITLGSNRFVPVEMLLDPSLVTDDVFMFDQSAIENVERLRTSAEPRGLHSLIEESVKKCDLDLSPVFYESIHFSGGCSLLRGLPQRVGSEIGEVAGNAPRIVAQTERRHAAFVGGSILASLPTFQDFWVTKAEYEEFGSSAVLRQCF
ncbi:actin-like protein [Trypanosoma grayi]|uniref:actin-like protein n=1 Tax=Trypanosoma grayi TaxID=71804 RepID=UPI0004F454F8|nr:actin-like protein [Trypanosoma grayi]KEG11006.1 actin-like protein [Trypanosoma grayi]